MDAVSFVGRRLLTLTHTTIESVPVVVSITPIVREARRGGPGRVAGYVEPYAGRGALWLSFEADLEEGVVRIDAKLRTGVLVSSVFEVFAEHVAGRADRARYKIGCPGCGHAVRHVYVSSYVKPSWGCRRCLRLTYESRRLRRPERALLMVRKRRAKLGTGGFVFEPLARPRGMRVETFARHEEYVLRQLDRYFDGNPARAARLARLAAKVARLCGEPVVRATGLQMRPGDTPRSTPSPQRPTTAPSQVDRTLDAPQTCTRG